MNRQSQDIFIPFRDIICFMTSSCITNCVCYSWRWPSWL